MLSFENHMINSLSAGTVLLCTRSHDMFNHVMFENLEIFKVQSCDLKF